MKFLSDILVKAGLTVENTFSALAASNTIYAGTGTRLRTEANNLVFERVSSSGTMKMVFAQGTLSPTAKSYIGYSNATLNLILANEYATAGLELRTSDVIRQQIFSNGNIVIGQASPVDAGYKMDVFGTVRASQLATGAHSFRNETYITPTTDGYTKQNSYNAASAYTMGFVGDLRFGAATAIKAVFSFNGAYSNNGTIYNGDVSLIKIFTSDAFGNPTPSANINGYGINLMPTLNYTQSTSNFTGIYYNPTLTATTGLTHYAMNLVSGLVRVGDLAGTGDRMVVANSSGVLSTQAIVNPSAVLPVGGTTGQILAKIDNTNYNTEWIDNYTGTVKHTVKAGVALTKGQAVYVSSADGTNMIVSKASNATESTSSKTMGLIAQSLSTNGTGFVVTEGLISGLDTSSAQAGDPVWLGTDGNLLFGLSNKPYAPNHLVYIGVVTRAQQNNGEIFVNVQNGFELNEIHNVQITSTPSDNTVLAYEASTSLYKMKSIATLLGYTPYDSSNPAGYISGITSNMVTNALGFTPVTNARTLTINGTTYDLTADRSYSVGTHTGSLTSGYIPKATGTTSLTDGLLYDTGSAVLLGTQTAGSGKFMVYSTTADNHYQAVGAAPSFRFADAITNPTYTGIIGMATASNNFIIGAAAGDMVLSNNTNSAGNFLFGTGATERMRINATTGNISINNTNNTYRLDVTGTGRFTGILTLDSQLSFTAAGINYIQATNAAGNLTFGVAANNNAFVVRSTGQVQVPTFTSGVVVSDAFGILSISTAYATQSFVTSQGYITSAALAPYTLNSRTLTINGTAFDLSADRSWSVGTVTSVGLTSATSGVFIGTTPITSSGTLSFTIATASGSSNGLLSSTDWTTFNNKQNALTNPVTGTGTTNYLPKFTGASTIGNSIVQDSGSAITIGGSLNITSYGNTKADQSAWRLYNTANTFLGGIGTRAWIDLSANLDIALYSVGSQLFYTNDSSTVKMTLNASGNLGLGVSPSAWASGYTAFQIENNGIMADGDRIWIYANGYFDGSSNRYLQNGFASRYYQANSSHVWETAPSGTAGNAISFTQAMTLDASGRLGIGTTSPAERLHIVGKVRFFDAGYPYIDLGVSTSNYWRIINDNPNDTFIIGKNGASNFVLNSSGAATFSSSVNIGSTLTVGSSSLFNGDMFTYQNGGIFFAGGGVYNSGIFGRNSGNDLAFNASSSERMRLTSTGLGIGTTAPIATLEVISSGRLAKLGTGIVFTSTNTSQAWMGSENWGWTGSAWSRTASSNAVIWGTGNNAGAFEVWTATTSDAASTAPTNSNSRFFVGNNGNVGIGTTSPAGFTRTLKINTASGTAGLLLADGDTDRAGFYIDAGTTAPAYIFTNNNKPLVLSVAGAERMRITSNGDVGIGSSSVFHSSRLSVAGRIHFQTSSNTDIGGAIYSTWTQGANSSDYYAGDLRFQIFNAASGTYGLREAMMIDGRGYVGIGTTTPSYTLDVIGSGRFTGSVNTSKLFVNTTTDYGNLNMIGYDNSGINIIDQRTSTSGVFYSAITFRDYYLGLSGAINFYHNQYFGSGVNRFGFAVNGADRLTILHNGNIGIGTSTPSETLQVGGFNTNNHIRINGYTGTQNANLGSIKFFNSISTEFEIARVQSGVGSTNVNDGYLSFFTGNAGSFTEKMRITQSGAVCINATATTQGAVLYANGTAAFGQVYAGNLSTGALYSNAGFITNTNPSDYRLKNTIKPLTYGLNEVLQLNPKTFYYNDDVTKARLKYGFIAQEVKEVMPDMVRLLGSEDYLGLESEGIWVTLVNAIKEQQVQLNEQRTLINELKSQLNK